MAEGRRQACCTLQHCRPTINAKHATDIIHEPGSQSCTAQSLSNRWGTCQIRCNLNLRSSSLIKSTLKFKVGRLPSLLFVLYLIFTLPLPGLAEEPEGRSPGGLRISHGGGGGGGGFLRRQGQLPDRPRRGNPRLGILERGPLTLINGQLRPVHENGPRPQPSINRNFIPPQHNHQRPIDRRIDKRPPLDYRPEPEIYLTKLPTASQDFDPGSQEFGQFQDSPLDQDRAASIPNRGLSAGSSNQIRGVTNPDRVLTNEDWASSIQSQAVTNQAQPERSKEGDWSTRVSQSTSSNKQEVVLDTKYFRNTIKSGVNTTFCKDYEFKPQEIVLNLKIAFGA